MQHEFQLDQLRAFPRALRSGPATHLGHLIPRPLAIHDLLVDTVALRTPSTSQLSEKAKKLALPSDNWLAGLAKVPYDIAWNEEIWLTPRYHRVQTVGHDPLLGLITGTSDILRQIRLPSTPLAGSPVLWPPERTTRRPMCSKPETT